MAATTSIIKTPDLLSPVNDIWGNYFLLGNPSYSLTNFKYVTNLYINNQFYVKETQPPRPTTGYGLYSPFQSLLTTLSYDLHPYITAPTISSNGICSYYINYGIEYNPGLTSAGLLDVISGGYHFFGLTFSQRHGFTAGDTIMIQTNNSYLAGTATIIATGFGLSSFAINKGFTDLSNVSTATITDLIRWEGTSNTYQGYNGTRQYGEQNINYYTSSAMITVGGPISGYTISAYGTGYVTGDTFSVIGGTTRAIGTVTANLGIPTNVVLNTSGDGYFPGGVYTTNAITSFGTGLTIYVSSIGTYSTKPFLTEYPQTLNKEILATQSETLSAFINLASFPGGTMSVTYKSYANNVAIGQVTVNTRIGTGSNIVKYDIPVGTNYLTQIGASAATDTYEVIISPQFERNIGPISFFAIGSTVSNPAYSAGQQVRVNGGNNDAIYQISVVSSGVPVGGNFVNYGTGYSNRTYTTTALSGTGSGFLIGVTQIIPSGVGITYSEPRRFEIVDDCSIYPNVRVMWLNKYGSFDYFNFNRDNKKIYDITRNEFKKVLPYDYTIGDRERTVLSVKLNETHVINTDWVSESVYEFLQGCFSSLEVYIIDENTGDTYPIIITDTSYEFKTAQRDQIFNCTVTYQTSYDIERQQQ